MTLVASFLLLAGPSQANSRIVDIAAASFDVVILRPCGLAALAVGAGLFLPATLLTAPNGRRAVEQAWNHFVTSPAESVLQRGLGDF